MSSREAASPFGKKLASNDKKIRDKAVKSLGRWLSSKTEFTNIELMKLWKGLFYCMWMSDKPLVQQALCDTLGSLVMKVPRQSVMPFIASFWQIMCQEWHGIDRLRLDKFYLLLRRFISNSFKMLNKNEWDLETVSEYSKVLIDGPLNAKSNTVPDGIRYHIIELYLEELEKVVDPAQSGEVPSAHLLEPMFELLGHTVNGKVFKKVAEEVFEAILRKTAAAEGEDSDFEEENDDELSVFDKPEVDENLDDEDEEDEDEDDEEAAAEAEAEAEAEMELDGEDAEEQEPTGFDYDLLGIKERLFAVGANKETVDQNRRKVYALYKAYQDFCPLEEDEGASDEEVEEEA